MVVVALATLYSVHRNHVEGQIESLTVFVQTVARESVSMHGEDLNGGGWHVFLQREMGAAGMPYVQPVVYVLDEAGDVMRHYPEHPAAGTDQVLAEMMARAGAAGSVQTVDSVAGQGGTWLATMMPLESGQLAGHVVAMMPLETMVPALERFRLVRLAGTVTVIIVGWLVVYLMTRRFVEPIRAAVAAVRQIVAGNYDVKLNHEQQQTKEIAELTDAFADMAERLRQHETLRRQLLAGVTHELRTPITSISGLIQAVRDGVVTGDEAAKFLDNSLKQTNRLQKLVDDLLDFNRFAVQEITVRKTEVHLLTLVKDVIQRWPFGDEAARSGLSVLVTADAERDWHLLTDPERIEQILINLLNNAREEMEEMEGMSGATGEIRIGLVSEHDSLLVHVADTGSGIPEDEQPYLFEPYYRGERKKRRTHGLGLGLSFSRLIARSLGGELDLAESHSRGTTFTLRLPRH